MRVLEATPLSTAEGTSSGVSSTGTVTNSSSSPASSAGACSCWAFSSATAGRAASSRGDSPMVSTAAADRPSLGHRSPSSHRRALMGRDSHKDLAAEAAVSLPAVTATTQSVPAASARASSRRRNFRGIRGRFIVCLTSGTTYAAKDGDMRKPGGQRPPGHRFEDPQCSREARMCFRAPLFSRANTRMPARMEPPTVDTRKGTT